MRQGFTSCSVSVVSCESAFQPKGDSECLTPRPLSPLSTSEMAAVAPAPPSEVPVLGDSGRVSGGSDNNSAQFSEVVAKEIGKPSSSGPDAHHYAEVLKTLDEIVHPQFALVMPLELYSLAVVMPCLTSHPNRFGILGSDCELALLIAFNNMIQIGLTINIYSIYQDALTDIQDDDCTVLNQWLLVTCIALHVAHALLDMRETLDMWGLFIRHIPTIPPGGSEVFHFNGDFKLRSGGLTFKRKVSTIIFILMPKFFISLFLLIFGGMYLAGSTSDGELLLNCMALVFILDVDEIVYRFFVPSSIQRLMDFVPPFAIETEAYDCAGKLGPTLKMVTLVLVVFALYQTQARCGRADASLLGSPSQQTEGNGKGQAASNAVRLLASMAELITGD